MANSGWQMKSRQKEPMDNMQKQKKFLRYFEKGWKIPEYGSGAGDFQKDSLKTRA